MGHFGGISEFAKLVAYCDIDNPFLLHIYINVDNYEVTHESSPGIFRGIFYCTESEQNSAYSAVIQGHISAPARSMLILLV